jgi:hypothetical protein
MRLAANPLQEAQAAAPEVAERVGYESGPSFSHAFTRRFSANSVAFWDTPVHRIYVAFWDNAPCQNRRNALHSTPSFRRGNCDSSLGANKGKALYA